MLLNGQVNSFLDHRKRHDFLFGRSISFILVHKHNLENRTLLYWITRLVGLVSHSTYRVDSLLQFPQLNSKLLDLRITFKKLVLAGLSKLIPFE